MNRIATSWIGMKVELVRLMHLLPGGEPGTHRRAHHQRLARERRTIQEHRAQYDRQIRDVPQTVEPPLLGSFRLPGPNFPGRAPVIGRVNDVEQRQQEPHAHRPHRPAMLGHPPERNAFQVTQEQRRVAHGRQAAAHVRDDEDEEDDVIAR